MVADEPVPPELLAQLLEQPPAVGRASCARELADGLRRGRPRLRAGARSPAATASRATPTWPRTSSASCSTASGPGCRRAALETLAIVAYKQPISRAQVAVDPRRQPRRRAAHPAGPRLHRPRSPATRARARRCCTARRRRSSRSSASTRSPTCRRSPSSSPAPTWSRRSSTACASSPAMPTTSEPPLWEQSGGRA